jgi:hypothetical protein
MMLKKAPNDLFMVETFSSAFVGNTRTFTQQQQKQNVN